MESKKVINFQVMLGLVLIATSFALTAFATAVEKDVITADAIHALTKSNKFPAAAIPALAKSKTMVSNAELEAAFPKTNAANADISIPCGESCVFIPCFSAAIGCSCRNKVCYRG